MTEKRTKYMIHESLESGGRITQAKGHDQKLIVTLMSLIYLRKLLKIHLQEDHPCSRHKEASIMIMISQGKNSEGLSHKEDHSLTCMQIYFMVIVFIILTLDIRLQIAGIIKEMFKQEMPMWAHVTLNVINVITMDT
jgi:hypothetical protein